MSDITLEQAKKALGKTGEKMTDKEVQNFMVTADLLTDSWMDMYLKGTFPNGESIKEWMKKRRVV